MNLFKIECETKRESGSRLPYLRMYFAYCDERGTELLAEEIDTDSQLKMMPLGSTIITLPFGSISQEERDAHRAVIEMLFSHIEQPGEVIHV